MSNTVSMTEFHASVRRVMAQYGLHNNTTFCGVRYQHFGHTDKLNVKYDVSFFTTVGDTDCKNVEGNSPDICIDRMKLVLEDIRLANSTVEIGDTVAIVEPVKDAA